jgi:gamma-glutamylcyclotransferase
MNGHVMRRHCPRHRYVGVASLDGHRLSFRRRSVKTGGGVADVLESPMDRVWGVLYELEDPDLRVLDQKEGNGTAYRRQLHWVRPHRGSATVEAILYTVIEKEPLEVPPTSSYLHGLLEAAGERALPDSYVAWLADLAVGLSSR